MLAVLLGLKNLKLDKEFLKWDEELNPDFPQRLIVPSGHVFTEIIEMASLTTYHSCGIGLLIVMDIIARGMILYIWDTTIM